ncbi:TPA: flagellar filament capping protein FliD [Morganella morganii]|uniref:flagellar filament capping protein FliD n=1 Tax=Morganella morganii TaxID=582 RepID=UPI001A26C77F|nr:flagellar filament capping protein FliD [Morganella morganii]HAT1527456.1 flagellar filament capping protein FliD [Morganella morganii]HDF2365548.1 flagellar filament capping protein FliD [Morganella morganii]HDF2424110.1 flagellar filament capping protein FliD [Morganella morganii]
MASITSLGIGSGLDTANMLEQLKYNEQKRLLPYTNMQNSYESKISAWGQISSSLDALNKSIKPLQGDAFHAVNVSSNKAFTATATSGAIADSHSVTVSQLATSHKAKTEPLQPGQTADTLLGDQNSGTRTVVIEQENGSEMRVELKNDETSLNQIAKAINKEDGDVHASVQNTDNGPQLVLTSKTTGTDGKMSVRVEGDAQLDGILHLEDGKPGMVTVADAKDAKLTVDGSDYTRSSNTIDDILTGVTLELKEVSEKDPSDSTGKTLKAETLSLTPDMTQYKTSIQNFVTEYNALINQTTASSKYVPSDSSGLTNNDVQKPSSENGALMGDSMLRGLVNETRTAVNGVYGENGAEYRSLADIGISIDPKTGLMTLSEDKLDAAIANDPDAVANIFMDKNGNEGLASTLGGIITKYNGDPDQKIEGSIKATTDSLNKQVEQVKEQIDRTQKLIDAQVERYRIQFQTLDTTMASLNSTSNQLGALISTLNN